MKREWEIEELIEHFSLSGPEMALVNGKVGHNQLGMAALLKCFQYEGKFPNQKREIPRAVVMFLAQQLTLEVEEFEKYSWRGRTMNDDRGVIRQYLGFREVNQEDKKALIGWLTTHPDMQHEHSEGYWLS